ncbi:MAG TPA: GNAT family N-acetyltransferase [Stellaceae bacterium]|nr:GNAT family N-acetyltransferase [Stellaceae bacterium]
MDTYSFEIRTSSKDEEKAAKACLTEHAAEVAGLALKRRSNEPRTMWDDDLPFAVLVRSHDRIVGGLIGKIFFNWLDAELVWLEKPFRRSGIGKAVLSKVEEKACAIGLTGIYLWTQSWQAPGFYRKLGYEQFAEFENFPPGHRRFGFRKYL